MASNVLVTLQSPLPHLQITSQTTKKNVASFKIKCRDFWATDDMVCSGQSFNSAISLCTGGEHVWLQSTANSFKVTERGNSWPVHTGWWGSLLAESSQHLHQAALQRFCPPHPLHLHWDSLLPFPRKKHPGRDSCPPICLPLTRAEPFGPAALKGCQPPALIMGRLALSPAKLRKKSKELAMLRSTVWHHTDYPNTGWHSLYG